MGSCCALSEVLKNNNMRQTASLIFSKIDMFFQYISIFCKTTINLKFRLVLLFEINFLSTNAIKQQINPFFLELATNI